MSQQMITQHTTNEGQDLAPDEDNCFLKIVHNPNLREALLARLQELKLLDAFLLAERGTTQVH